jgi:membrane-associated phospholipid phosphatase
MQPHTTIKTKQKLVLFSGNRTMLLALLTGLLIFGWVACLVFIQKNSSFDNAIFKVVSPYESPLLTKIVVFISFLGKHTFLIPANLLLIFYFLYKKRKELAYRLFAIAISSYFLKVLLKIIFNRPRPADPLIEHVQGLSFPSGHALMAVTVYGFIAVVLWYEIKNQNLRNFITAFLMILILSITFSRVYMRVHYMSDVIAGLAIGFIWLALLLWAIDKLEKHYENRKKI